MSRIVLIALLLLACAVSGSAQSVFFEDFSSLPSNGTTTPPAGWVNVAADSGDDWFGRNTNTTSSGTGPPADHTTGVPGGQNFYMYVEDSGSEQQAIELKTPQIDLGALTDPVLRFCVHSHDANGGSTANSLAVDVENVTTGVTTPDVVTIGHMTENDWTIVIVDLTAFIGDTVCFVFRGRTDNGTFAHDIAIDDVEVRQRVLADLGFLRPALNSPVDADACGQMLGQESVTFDLANFGDAVIPAGTTFDVSLVTDTGVSVTETFTLSNPLQPAESTTGFLNALVDFSTVDLSDTDIEVTVDLIFAGIFIDENPTNDSFVQCIEAHVPAVVQAGHAEDFNSVAFPGTSSTLLPGCYMQVNENPGGTSLQVQLRNSVSSFVPGAFPPNGDPTTPGGNYVFGDSTTVSGIDTPLASLLTPQIDVPTDGSSLIFKCKVWSNDQTNGAVGNTLTFSVLDGVSLLPLFPNVYTVGNLGHEWFDRAFVIPQTTASTVVIEATFDLSNGPGHNIAFDDVSVASLLAQNGQPGSPSAALVGFDADGNIAQDASGVDPLSFTPGPFELQVDVNETFRLDLMGPPNAAFARFVGVPGVNNIPIPGLGQIDIGSGFDDIAVIGDGTQPGPGNQFFFIASGGWSTMYYTVPPALGGTSFAFQDAVFSFAVFLANALVVNAPIL